MSDDPNAKKQRAPGFWRKLVQALEGMDESYVDSLETRIHALEVEVARLGALERRGSSFSAPDST
ncbi:hypothetical protein [Variovorax atrisoli]|uniref:hypothetical protein n=1 Tax=Variovorax atrisoli TaxID=3394203 RepID=UPI00339B9B2A